MDTIVLIARNVSDTWDIRIRPALMAIRSCAQSTTGFSPHYLLFNREMRLPADIFYELPQESLKSLLKSVAQLKKPRESVRNSDKQYGN